MNSSSPREPWPRLAAAARRASELPPAEAPFGFSTRVAALAFAAERRAVSVLERLSLRALGVAGLLALASVAFTLSALQSPSASVEELLLPNDDAVDIVLDLSSV
jgi:hypothetical protein